MADITIKVNKTVLFVVVALLIGIGLGYGGGALLKAGNNEEYVLPNTNQLPPANQPAGPSITLSTDDNIRGAKKPLVTLVEFSDFQCPYCKNFHAVMQQVIQKYGDKIAWIFRHFPLSFHENAQIAAEASECAAEQNKFWEYADLLFQKGNGDGVGLAKTDLQKYASQLGLNTSKFNSCLESGKYTEKVNTDMASGAAAGIQGTPGTVLVDKNGNTQLISGAVPYESLKAVIDAAL